MQSKVSLFLCVTGNRTFRRLFHLIIFLCYVYLYPFSWQLFHNIWSTLIKEIKTLLNINIIMGFLGAITSKRELWFKDIFFLRKEVLTDLYEMIKPSLILKSLLTRKCSMNKEPIYLGYTRGVVYIYLPTCQL